MNRFWDRYGTSRPSVVFSAAYPITLENDFHNTSVNLVGIDLPGSRIKLSSRQRQRAKRILCGIADCSCGNELGSRPEEIVTYLDGHELRQPYSVESRSDGSIIIKIE